jgi:adenosylcobinamide-GDP ribazoletransferase
MPAASLRACAAAVAFLTRAPIGRTIALDGGDVARGVVVFPVVGAAIGAATAAVVLVAEPTLSPLLAAALGVGAAVALTGAMHLDALADTADALGASTRERALEVMRDPRIGTFGAAALVVDVVVKVAALQQLLATDDLLYALIAAGALSRAASPVLASLLPYPRVGGGPGSVLSGRVSRVAAGAGALAAVAATVALLDADGLVVAGSVAVLTATLGLAYRRWLGGATGDCLGAATELSETLALVAAAAVLG